MKKKISSWTNCWQRKTDADNLILIEDITVYYLLIKRTRGFPKGISQKS